MSTCRIVLCADDYAMSAGVSRGILELARAGRISATSVMANMPGWPEHARKLADIEGRIGIGLHLTLTWGTPLGPMPRLAPAAVLPPLGRVIRAALAGAVPKAEVTGEIERQLDAFEAALGGPPDFVDGHQHVHALPGLRGPLLHVLAGRGLSRRLWLRDPADNARSILRRGVAAGKALTVAAFSAGFGREARRAGFTTNRGFSGFSPFDAGREPGADMARFLRAPGPAHLVMCHPGHVGPGETLDGIADARARELAYLASDAFPALLRARGLELVPTPA
jgi:predicted glycoside hydrolase/deacetylase ChbG (UPF0249 family)